MGAMGMPYGLQAMLKEGHKHFSGLDEAVYKNIEAGKQLSQIARTSMGPNGESLQGSRYHWLSSSSKRLKSAEYICCLSVAVIADLRLRNE